MNKVSNLDDRRKLNKAMEDNPDLPREFIEDLLKAKDDETEPYARRITKDQAHEIIRACYQCDE